MKNLEFENRNNSLNPIIERLKYNDRYIYVITTLTGCNCRYVGCDSYSGFRVVLKVREVSENKKDCNLILSKSGKTKIKLTKRINEEEAIEIFKREYNNNN